MIVAGRFFQDEDSYHRWLFCTKDGQEIKFSSPEMPFAVFKDDAVWGGSCLIGDIKCSIRIVHNKNNAKGETLEVRFPHKDLGMEYPIERTTLVGYIAIKGNFSKGTGKCYFRLFSSEESK